MGEDCGVVQVIMWLCVTLMTLVPTIAASSLQEQSGVTSTEQLLPQHQQLTTTNFIVDEVMPRFLSAIAANTTLEEFLSEASTDEEGRARKKKYKKHEIMMLTKMLMGLKVALLGVVLPLAVLAAKLLSWKAVTLSLLAFMLAKIVFVKNLVMGKSTPTSSPPTAPSAPIIIHSPPAHETIWKRASQPRIHLQPEVHVHHSEEHHAPSPATWTWAEETRAVKHPHQLAYATWVPDKS